jgi:hypothetical protein
MHASSVDDEHCVVTPYRQAERRCCGSAIVLEQQALTPRVERDYPPRLAREHDALRITRIGYLETGQAVELTHSYCRSDYYDFVAEMRRDA